MPAITITSKELMELWGCGRTKAQSIIREVNQDIKDSGKRVMSNRRAPRTMVLEKLGLKGD